jgi:hypothetical protein
LIANLPIELAKGENPDRIPEEETHYQDPLREINTT